jgi:hypothetical protein
MVGLGLSVDNRALTILSGLEEAISDWSVPLANFHAYMIREVDEQFKVAGDGTRSTFARGVWWPGFAPQYTRKTDGVVVPAWGGVPNIGQYSWINQRRRESQKARGEKADRTNRNRKVKGRKRPSGQRITPSSKLMQDTGATRATAMTGFVEETPTSITMGPGTPYAARQNAMRQFVFFQTPKDQEELERQAMRWLRTEVKGLEARGA